MSEFWYWWDRNIIDKPPWKSIGRIQGSILLGGTVGYVVASLLLGSWTRPLWPCLMGLGGIIILINLAMGVISTEIGKKYQSDKWDWSHNRKEVK